MLTVVVRHNKETGPEHVGNWSTEHEFAADRIDDLTPQDLYTIRCLITRHGMAGVRIYNEERRCVWPPPPGEPWVAL
jgi:hypothetical protein